MLHSFAVIPLDVAPVTITVATSHFMLDVLFSYKVTVYSMPLGIISHIIEVYVAKHNLYASPNISVTHNQVGWDGAYERNEKYLHISWESKGKYRQGDLGLDTRILFIYV